VYLLSNGSIKCYATHDEVIASYHGLFLVHKTFHKSSLNDVKMIVYYGVIGQVGDYMILMNK
jgi:hypothetical protein